MPDDDQTPSPRGPIFRPSPVPLGVVGAVTLDAIAVGAASALVVAAGTDDLDRGLALGVLVAVVTAALIGTVRVVPVARPGMTARLLGRELAVLSLAILSLPVSLAVSFQETLRGGTIAVAAVVAVALALRMALLTRRAGQFGRAQAGRVAQLTRLSLHDPLTGLPNRTLLEDRLAMALAGQRRSGSVLALLYCDLDRFKVVNDTLGHDYGDGVLVVTAERLRSAVRATDTVSRLGGDEFVVLCPDLSSEDELTDVVERMLGLLSEPMVIAGQPIEVSGSVGVSFVRAGATAITLADLLREADAAMYRAKANGRNRWERVAPGPLPRPESRSEGLRDATVDAAWTFWLPPTLGRPD